MEAVIKDANAPPIIALKTNSEISFFAQELFPQYPLTEYQWNQN